MEIYHIDGSKIGSSRDFHEMARVAFDFGPFYGANSDAFWDFMTTEVPRPLLIVWSDALQSAEKMGREYSVICHLLDLIMENESQHADKFLFLKIDGAYDQKIIDAYLQGTHH